MGLMDGHKVCFQLISILLRAFETNLRANHDNFAIHSDFSRVETLEKHFLSV